MKEDLAMWLIILKDWNGKASWRSSAEVRLVHDASERGFGFILDGLPPGFDISALPEHLRGGTGFAGTFADNMVREGSKHSIQFGELFAIVFSIALYGPTCVATTSWSFPTTWPTSSSSIGSAPRRPICSAFCDCSTPPARTMTW
jgi:hypothetical protein